MALTRFLLPLLLALWLLPTGARAACECGYLDPDTNALWTDATITYFNETGAAQMVNETAKPPGIYGQETAGETGDGQEAWAVVGNHINKWETSFGATYLTAVSFNNTYIDNNSSLGLAMQVSPANPANRIVNGSRIVTRRRDIQFGTFRAMILPAPFQGSGAAFKFGASYNESETIDLGLFVADKANQSTLRWSFSASGADADPIKTNFTYFETKSSNLSYLESMDFVEHRFDWLGKKLIQFRNNAPNRTMNFESFHKGENATNLPTMPAPISFQTWANGESTQSQGPPLGTPMVTRILYTRFFYNSSLPERTTEFLAQCQAASGPNAVCSTEDHTLRDSTPFTPLSLARVAPIKLRFQVPLYAIIVESFFALIVAVIIGHGIFVRKADARRKKEAAAFGAEEKDESEPSFYNQSASASRIFSNNSFNASKVHPFEQPFNELWDVPDLMKDMDSDNESDDGQDPFDDAEDQLGRLAPVNEDKDYINDETNQAHTDLPSFSSFRPDIAAPSQAYPRQNLPYATPAFNSSAVDNYTSMNNNASSTSILLRQNQPQIVQWRKRRNDDGGDVGELAQPTIGDKGLNRLSRVSRRGSRPQSTMFVTPSLFTVIANKIWDFFFVEGSSLTTSTGDKRIDYLDGMRGFACLLVSVGHFILIFYYGIADPTGPKHYPKFEYWMRVILGPIIINAGMVLGIFFVLPSRTMCLRYLMKGGLQSMADSTIRRMPRLILPVAGAVLANYFLMDVDAFKWVPRLSSRTWSPWSYWQNFDNVMVFFNAFITLWYAGPPVSPALVTGYATGVLWTIPVIIQGMWTSVLTALIAYEMKTTWKRYAFYFGCVFFSWYANTWDLFFMSGLIVADLDAKVGYRKLAAKGVSLVPRSITAAMGISDKVAQRLSINGSIFAWLFFAACAAQQYLNMIPNAPGWWFDIKEHRIHPNWETSEPHSWSGEIGAIAYTNPRFSSWALVMSIFILADLSPLFRLFFKLKIWAWFGKHSLAYFLCHGIIFWSWGAWLCLAMVNAGIPYWATILTVFFTSYILLAMLCICFTYTFEFWGILLSKAVWRATSGGLGRKY